MYKLKLISLALILAFAGAISAATICWDGGAGNGNWEQPNNWYCAEEPRQR